MVTAEGVFPKIGNDPLYDSEVNRFVRTTTILAGSGGYVGSATGQANVGLGSIWVSGTNFNLKDKDKIEVHIQFNSNITNNIQTQISGTRFGDTGQSSNTSVTADDMSNLRFSMFAGSQAGESITSQARVGIDTTGSTIAKHNVGNRFVGSGFVILFREGSWPNPGSTGIRRFFVKHSRGDV